MGNHIDSSYCVLTVAFCPPMDAIHQEKEVLKHNHCFSKQSRTFMIRGVKGFTVVYKTKTNIPSKFVGALQYSTNASIRPFLF